MDTFTILGLVKKTLSVGVIGGLGWYYVHDLTATKADYAMVTAPLRTVSAPFDGQLVDAAAASEVLDAGAKLVSLRRTSTNDGELRRAEVELAALAAEIKSLDDLVKFGVELLEGAKRSGSSLRANRARQLENSHRQVASELEVTRTEAATARESEATAEPLCSAGLMSARQCTDLKTSAEVREKSALVVEQKLALAELALKSSRQGADLGSDNAPQLVQQEQYERNLEFRLADLRRDLGVRRARAEALKTRMTNEAESTTDLTAQHRLLVWSVDAARGMPVGQGQPLLQAADCSKMFVFARLPATKYSKISVGTEAIVKLKDERFTGRVTQLLGPPDALAYTNHMAPAPPQRRASSAEQGAVAITVPELTKRLLKGCEVGTAPEVSFVTH